MYIRIFTPRQFGFTKQMPFSAAFDAFFGSHLVTRDFTLPTRPHPRYHHAPVKLAHSAPPSSAFHQVQPSVFQHRPSNQKLYEGAENGFTSSFQRSLGSGQATRTPTRLPWPISSRFVRLFSPDPSASVKSPYLRRSSSSLKVFPCTYNKLTSLSSNHFAGICGVVSRSPILTTLVPSLSVSVLHCLQTHR
jgi:hypothetical protein